MRNTARYAAGLLVAAGAVFAFASPAAAAVAGDPYDPYDPYATPGSTTTTTSTIKDSTLFTSNNNTTNQILNDVRQDGGKGTSSIDLKNVGVTTNVTNQLNKSVQVRDVKVSLAPVKKTQYNPYNPY